MAFDDETSLLALAVQRQIITEKQAAFIREEIRMFPGMKAGNLLLQRKIVDAATLAQLRGGAGVAPAPPPSAAAPAPPTSTAATPSRFQAASPGMPRAGGEGGFGGGLRGMPTGAPVAAGGPQASATSAPEPVIEIGPEPARIKPPPEALRSLNNLLRYAREIGASDVHLTPEREPYMRKNGRVVYLDAPPLAPERSEELNLSGLNVAQQQRLLEKYQLDFALEIPGVGRHRCNVFRQRLGWDGAYRIIPTRVPSADELGLPDAVKAMTAHNRGLVVVTGPSGSGKTTTVAAMIDLVNKTRDDHVITVEDPVEYVIPSAHCQITQREVGGHTESFGTALRAALREDPDIIFVGEMRDFETVSIAISAAETGHLVFGTLHTGSAARTVARILDVYPLSQREQVCIMVSESMKGVVAQQLLPRKDGAGQVLALEILVVTAGIGAQIREGKTFQIPSLIQTGKRVGMKLMDESIKELLDKGLVTGRDAYLRAENKALFEATKDK